MLKRKIHKGRLATLVVVLLTAVMVLFFIAFMQFGSHIVV